MSAGGSASGTGCDTQHRAVTIRLRAGKWGWGGLSALQLGSLSLLLG